MNGFLLDTHVLLWVRLNEPVSAEAYAVIESKAHPVYYSIITPWKLAIKQGKGKLALPEDFFTTLPPLGFDLLPVKESHIETLRALPRLHGDPFDRMLVAQAKKEKLTLITRDPGIQRYGIRCLLA